MVRCDRCRSRYARRRAHPDRAADGALGSRRAQLGRETMCASMRPILPAVLLSIGLAVSGCETSDIMDKMQDFNPLGVGKKPLPGSRKALFPEGVPGVQQGIPPDLVRGAPQQTEPEPVAQPKVAEPKARARRPRTAAAPPVQRPPRPPRRQAAPPPDEPAPDGVWPPPPRASRTPPPAPAAAPPPPPPGGGPAPPPDLFSQPPPRRPAPNYQWPDEVKR